MENYSHIVIIDAEKKLLKIFRLFDNGRKEFFTECSIDDISATQDWAKFSEFSKQLGENILMDSPAARACMQL